MVHCNGQLAGQRLSERSLRSFTVENCFQHKNRYHKMIKNTFLHDQTTDRTSY